MPIPMQDDPRDQRGFNDSNSSGESSGGSSGRGGLSNFLPEITGLFGSGRRRRGGGKGGFTLLLLLGVVVCFFFFRNSGGVSDVQNVFSQSGYSFSPEQFKKASVYEALEADNTKNPLPESVSLLRFAPDRKNQGKQGSCVAWSSVYAARTIVEAASKGISGNSTAFSPAFVYSQIGLEDCQGSYIQKAMEFMTNKGVLPYNDFPYMDEECNRQPNTVLWGKAAQHRMHGFTRLTEGESIDEINIRAVKEHLANDAPVVIGMMVGSAFMQGMMGKDEWAPNEEDLSEAKFSGHALCVIGYDDRRQAFLVMNSWGPEWGHNGVAWVGYADFRVFVKEAYGIDPMPKRSAALSATFECAIGLVKNADQEYIPLKVKSGNVFETVHAVARGTAFKMEIKNTTECNIYIFGQKNNGSSYTLFPYPDKTDPTKTQFSPHCGITGYRLFPGGKSRVPDDVGIKDIFAVVVTKKPIDWYAINSAISKSSRINYGGKVQDAFGGSDIANVHFSKATGGTIQFKVEDDQKNAVISIVEINKQ